MLRRRRHRMRWSRRWYGRINAPLHAAWMATLLCALLFIGHARGSLRIPGLDGLELTFTDAMFRLRGSRSPAPGEIVIVGLDDQTRREAPEIFQSRRGWAKLLRKLAGYEPLAIGIDATFDSPELAVDPEVVEQVKKAWEALRVQVDPPRTPAADQALAALDAIIEQTRGDEELARTIKEVGNIQLGVTFLWPGTGKPVAPPGTPEPPGLERAGFTEVAVVDQPATRRPPDAYWVVTSLPKFTSAAKDSGALNVIRDDDGQVRRVYGVLAHGGRYYMPLGMSMALARLGPDQDTSYVTGDRHITAGERELPSDARGRLLLNHLGGKKTFSHISGLSVLAGTARKEDLKGRLVFIGFTDVGRDKIATPFETSLDGVEIHATLAHNILHGELMRRAGPNATLLTIVLLGLLLVPVQLRRARQRRSWLVPGSALAVVLGYLLVAYTLFARGLIVDIAAPVLSSLFVALVSLSALAITEGRERAQLRSMFSQYVGGSLLEQIIAEPESATLGGKRRELTVLFSDIRGFSSFSEKLEPEELSDFLNQYLTPMTELVMNNGGMLDKYIGDAVMAVFGAPPPQDRHALYACRTALAMIAELDVLNRRFTAKGLPAIAIGIGINSGPMSVGNMGSATRFNYTVMGDAVNLGARLEGLTKEYRCDILVGENTAQLAKSHFVFRELDLVRVKGRAGTARIYQLMGAKGSVAVSHEELSVFATALEAYREHQWDRAADGFTHYLKRYPDDGPANVMLERIEDLRANPPGDEWDGVFDQRFK